jgi:hypothetical protein
MRVAVEPRRLSIVPGAPSVITVSISNTGTVISGHRVRLLGVDPQWVTVDQDTLSLFPDTSGVAVVNVTLPKGLPAGPRTLTVEVTELTPPNESAVVDVQLMVPAELGLKLALDPVSITGGRAPSVALVLENTGNSEVDVHLEGADEEGAIAFSFTPPEPTLAQGDQTIGTVKLKAHRPWFGSPKVRSYTVRAGPPRAPVIAFGAWVQKPRLSRGALALLGLLVAATVFALVITASLSHVVDNSNADRDLAIQVAEASQNPGGAAGAGGAASAATVTGAVTLLTSGAPVPGVTVQIYTSANPTSPIASTATAAPGTYSMTGLTAGSYKLEFEGAGFNQLWYPDSLTAANAGVVTLSRGATTKGIDIRLGGLPASVSGQVVGADPNGALLTLEVPPAGGAKTSAATAPTGTVVTTETLSSTGNFALANIPSPALYQLVVTKSGYAPAVQEVDLAGGEQRRSVTITLHQGDGSITGTVSSVAGPLGGATVSASDGTTTVSTVSVSTVGSVGTFVLSNLPTPAAFTLVVSDTGYATQTLSLSLSADQQLTGVAVSLTPGLGSVSGIVSVTALGTPSGEAPAGGVTVTATDGTTTVTAVTLSIGAVGTYSLANLAVPGTYTVTFSRSDLASQTQALSLSSTGPTNLTNVDADMVAKTATLYGTVTETGGQGLGEVAILLSSGNTSYQVTSASVPTAGAYEIDGIIPGTYTVSFTRTGGAPTSSIVTLTAGQRLEDNPVLNAAASIYGHVVEASNPTQVVGGAQVSLYLASQYPTVVSSTVLTDPTGNFTFSNVQAPEDYIVAFAYPQGASNQESVAISTTLGTASPVCGSQATGGSTPTSTPTSATTTTLAPTTTVAPTTASTSAAPPALPASPQRDGIAAAMSPTATIGTPATTADAPATTIAPTGSPVRSQTAACNPTADPILVNTQ